MKKTIFESGIWRPFSFIADLFLMNMLWLVTSLPVFTIGASTTAMYYVTIKRLKDKDYEVPLLRTYKKAFLSNFKQATFLWLFYLFVLFDFLIICYMIYGNKGIEYMKNDRMFLFCAVFVICIYVFTLIYIFPLLAVFSQSSLQCFVNALGISFKYIFSTLGFVSFLAVMGFLCWFGIPVFFLSFSFFAWMVSRRFIKISDDLMHRNEEEKDTCL